VGKLIPFNISVLVLDRSFNLHQPTSFYSPANKLVTEFSVPNL